MARKNNVNMNSRNNKQQELMLKNQRIQELEQQLQEALTQIELLKLDVKKFNDAAYKAKKQVSTLQSDVKKFNDAAYKAKKEVRTLKSLVDARDAYILKLKNGLMSIVKDHNVLIDRYNKEVISVDKQMATLSYDIGKSVLQLRTRDGIVGFIPSIFEAGIKFQKKKKEGKVIKKLPPVYIDNLLEWEAFTESNLKKSEYSPTVIDDKKQKHVVVLADLERKASVIPDSNGVTYYKKIPLNVAIITDEFMFNYYNGAFENLYYVNPDNYKVLFEKNKIDILMYVSCWSGMINEDWRGIKFREKPRSAFEDILRICKEKAIKTIFQTIEDPSNYDNFLPIAGQFEYIFTSAIEKIEDYKRDCNNKNVYYLEYGFNPVLNNPIGIYRDVIDGVFFAGSYPQRYVDRCNDMHTLFSSVKKSGAILTIADRNSQLQDEKLKFPKEYQDFVIPAIQHKLLQKVHKLFRYNANFNSIKDSSTMCAMRIYELQAQGSLILSNYALSVSNRFPNIRLVNQIENLSPLFLNNKNITLDELIARVNTLRGVLNDKSVFDQTVEMLTKCGFNVHRQLPRVLVIYLDGAMKLIEQTYSNYDTISYRDVSADFIKEFDYVCFVSSKNLYSRNYIQDLLNGFKYVDVDFITQSARVDADNSIIGQVYEYINGECIIDQSLIKTHVFDLQNMKVNSRIGFAIEPFGLDFCVVNEKQSPKLSVIIPVYNNGRFLRDRCLASLKLDKNFSSFEVILVDDGSDDFETLNIIDSLQDHYVNVFVFKYPEGGSGSASRARNKGAELATAEFITYLDPDNEISINGYSKLLELFDIQTMNGVIVDFITGYQNKITEMGISRNAYHTNKSVSYIADTKYFIQHKNYPIISTQAFVCKKSLIANNNIKFVEGAVGQDTLFGHEVMAYAKGGLFSGEVYINYYAERKSSVTNVINKQFFEKSLILEKYQVHKFKQLGIFEHYRDNKFPKFYKDWYLEKLNQVPIENRLESKTILDKITSLYK